MNLDYVDQLIEKMNKSSLSVVEYKDKDVEIKLKKEVAPVQVQSQPMAQPVQPESVPQEQTPQPQKTNGKVIKAPMVGTFYKASSPEAEAFVKVGDTVNNDTVVCILEAMKLFNEIEAEMSGEILEILVEDGEMVEYNQPMFIVQ